MLQYVISKDLAITSQSSSTDSDSSSNDLDKDGKDNSAKYVSHLIGMHQLFQIMRSNTH